jgi:hypothetical protein
MRTVKSTNFLRLTLDRLFLRENEELLLATKGRNGKMELQPFLRFPNDRRLANVAKHFPSVNAFSADLISPKRF